MAPDSTRANLILAGFMGTGKSSVGRRIAGWWAAPFVDFDAVLEARFGRPVSRIFAEEGEAAFRAAESALCGELPPGAGLVAATGGGAVVAPANRVALQARGVLICLGCRPDVLLARLRAVGQPERPLLGADPSAALARLLAARAPAYAAIPWQVDTTDLDIDAVARRVLDVYRTAVVQEEDRHGSDDR